jgi:hypothetical protein
LLGSGLKMHKDMIYQEQSNLVIKKQRILPQQEFS